ncbi:unnamed protein product [marine sediment metagenome]|uniref:SCP2 domain-containing protein n=1 Tax=marine sediment metagenome TaxID=412755 RepID=X1JFN2_9ZZZZ
MDIRENSEAFFKRLVKLEKAKKLLTKKKRCVLFKVIDGSSFVVNFQLEKVEVIDKPNLDSEVELKVESDSQTYRELFDGKITPAEAYHAGRLFFDGIPYKGYPWLTRLIRITQTGR